ncbi:MAG: FAD-binding oxidoreductase [Rhodobacteraceae bacterium]|nr:FAD-binding oxidoreductase [Paracoccaceae bacterium]
MGESCEIAVIGAGVIGLAVAHRLAGEGRDVLLIDPAEPGSGASHGNAGTVAGYAVQPLGTPAMLRSLPSLLFDRDSPLSIRRAAILSLAPWLVRLVVASRPAAAARGARLLAGLLADAGDRWEGLAAEVGWPGGLADRGCLYLYADAAEGAAGARDIAARRALGVTVEILSPGDLARMEPGLPAMAGGAAFFPGARFLRDPGRMMARLAEDARARGVRLLRAAARGLGPEAGGVGIATGAGHVRARRAVIAAGAHSRPLARMAGDRVPLDTERGYHLEYDGEEVRLTRPACPVARGFYLCPMAGRLRAAGTVELGGLGAPPSARRIARLDEGARAVFPDLPAPSRSWMGLRPSIPDSLPVVGPARALPEVIHAFGHGHLGVTLAPVTAAIVAALVAGRTPPVDIAGLSPGRF